MFLNRIATALLIFAATAAQAQSSLKETIPGLDRPVYKIKSQLIGVNGKVIETASDRARNCGDLIRPVIKTQNGQVFVRFNEIHGFEWSEGTAPAESLGECRTHVIKKIERSGHESSLMVLHAEQCPDGQSMVGSIREDYAFYGDTVVYRNGYVAFRDGQWRADESRMSYVCTWSAQSP